MLGVNSDNGGKVVVKAVLYGEAFDDDFHVQDVAMESPFSETIMQTQSGKNERNPQPSFVKLPLPNSR